MLSYPSGMTVSNRALIMLADLLRQSRAERRPVAPFPAEGRTRRDIIRSLKRYISRELFRTLTAAHLQPNVT